MRGQLDGAEVSVDNGFGCCDKMILLVFSLSFFVLNGGGAIAVGEILGTIGVWLELRYIRLDRVFCKLAILYGIREKN